MASFAPGPSLPIPGLAPAQRATSFMSEITEILQRAVEGDPAASDELLSRVYDELRHLASRKMAGEATGHTLQPTALVHEAWLKIGVEGEVRWRDRGHFFRAAAEAMRRILIDHARRKKALRRGGAREMVALEGVEIAAPAASDELLSLNEALEQLAAVDARKADLVKLRYFAGLSFDETAAALGIAVPTAKEWWSYSRAWLRVEMAGQQS
jgi:RNA polymerase sigma factor (TIGR02999 family)